MKKITISEFARLTNSTLKTVLYYHKIGLMPEPERSGKGYRLYGSEELSRMRVINHLKSQGLDLKRVKEIMLGDGDGDRPLWKVLESLRDELLHEKSCIEDRLERIDRLLIDAPASLDESEAASLSFQTVAGILGQSKMNAYAKASPKLLEQQKRIFEILDEFRWGEDPRDDFKELAMFFDEHPAHYETALTLGARLSQLDDLTEDDPTIDVLAREAAGFVKSAPRLRALLSKPKGMKASVSELYETMVADIIPASHLRFSCLFQDYLRGD